MSRRASAPTRTILPDPRFNSLLLAKFVNMVMERGKKSVAEKIVYGAVDRIAEKTGKAGEQSIELLSMALDNVKPTVEVKSRRVGGATYQVPVEVRSARRQTLAMRWVIEAAQARSEKSMPGDNIKMVIELIAPIAMEQGLRFAIREGGKTVGSGVVAKVLK